MERLVVMSTMDVAKALLRCFANRTYDPVGITSAISLSLRKMHWAFVDGRIVGMGMSHFACHVGTLAAPSLDG
eukprot:666393-Lingulodinium_polyedra.AAC.1